MHLQAVLYEAVLAELGFFVGGCPPINPLLNGEVVVGGNKEVGKTALTAIAGESATALGTYKKKLQEDEDAVIKKSGQWIKSVRVIWIENISDAVNKNLQEELDRVL